MLRSTGVIGLTKSDALEERKVMQGTVLYGTGDICFEKTAAEEGTDHGCRHDSGSKVRDDRGKVNAALDDAYRAKYSSSPCLGAIIRDQARSGSPSNCPQE